MVWFLAAIFAAQIGVVCVAIRVAVFEPSESYDKFKRAFEEAEAGNKPSSNVPVPKLRQR